MSSDSRSRFQNPGGDFPSDSPPIDISLHSSHLFHLHCLSYKLWLNSNPFILSLAAAAAALLALVHLSPTQRRTLLKLQLFLLVWICTTGARSSPTLARFSSNTHIQTYTHTHQHTHTFTQWAWVILVAAVHMTAPHAVVFTPPELFLLQLQTPTCELLGKLNPMTIF